MKEEKVEAGFSKHSAVAAVPLGMLTALILLLGLAVPAADAAPQPADTVLRNGFVYTVDKSNSVKNAVAIRNGELVYVGSNKGVRKFIGKHTKVTNLGGRMVMPGMVDGHIHDVTKPAQATCDLGGRPLTVDQLRSMVTACLSDPELHTSTPGAADDFLLLSDFYIQFLRPAGTAPTKALFDGLTDRPIMSSLAVTGHGSLVNQAALDLAGITAATPDPEGGHIKKGLDGEPSGMLVDAAARLVSPFIPSPPTLTEQEEIDHAGARMKEFNEVGITSFLEPGGGEFEQVEIFQKLRQQHGLTARAHFSAWTGYGDEIADQPLTAVYNELDRYRKLEKLRQLPRQVYAWRAGEKTRGPRLVAEPGVAVDGPKFLVDGVLQAPQQSAALFEPYLNEDGNPRTDPLSRGLLMMDSNVLDPVVAGVIKRGYQPHIHAIGDRAVNVTLNALQQAKISNPSLENKARPTIAHAELVTPADVPRFAELNTIASMGLQWAKPAPDSTEAVKPFLGEARWNLYEPSQPITKAGGMVTQGSDCCLDPLNPFFGLEATVLRESDWGPDFPQFEGKVNALPGLSLKKAIRVMTINGAYQLHLDRVAGSLERGKLADLLVLDRNITKIPTDDISETNALMTMVGGKRVFVDPSMRARWGGEENFASKPPARKAGLGLTVSPKKAKTRANGQAIFTAKVASTGTGRATGVKVCLRALKTVKGSGCAGFRKLAPGSTRTVKFRVRPAATTKTGATYRLRFTATGKGARPVSRTVKLKVQR